MLFSKDEKQTGPMKYLENFIEIKLFMLKIYNTAMFFKCHFSFIKD